MTDDELRELFGGIERRISAFESRFEARVAALENRFEARLALTTDAVRLVGETVAIKGDSLETTLHAVEHRLERVERRVEFIATRYLEARTEDIAQRRAVLQRIEGIEQKGAG